MEEEHSQEINKLHLEASKNEIVPFKDSKNDDYHSLRGEDKVSNCFPLSHLGPVWYVCLKTENCCLKIFVEVRVGEKVY